MTAPVVIPSIYDTYNAKWMSAREVAQSFVSPPQFAQIVGRSNSLIVGPRGCGKTTILKMLTEPARDLWVGPDAERYRPRIDYAGVFVATDVTWNSQVSALGDERLTAQSRRSLQVAALTAHAHKALIEAMEARAQRLQAGGAMNGAVYARDQEARVAGELMQLWKLDARLPSFHSLKTALRGRLQHVHEVAADVAALPAADQPARIGKEGYLNAPLLVSCRNAVEQFNDTFNDPDRFWALLFDELELMPAAVREELFVCLRTLPDRVLFKLALSPFDEELPGRVTTTSAQPTHDYDFIPLWFARKRKGNKFCEALWTGMTRGTRLQGTSPEQVLGRSILDTESSEWTGQGTAYANGSRHHEYVLALAGRDASFRQYLTSNGINVDDIQAVQGTRRAATLRKVFPLIVARVEYAKAGIDSDARPTQTQSQLRSRKISMIYTGAMSLFDICEGNPRVFKGLMSRLLERLPPNETRVDLLVEADEITQAISRFRALLRTIVVPNARQRQFPRGLLSLLDPIAKRMQREALVDSFGSEPAASFKVDSSVPDDVVRMIGYAVNAGAIIYVPDREGDDEVLSIESVRERRFRLSYLFAAQYGIVPRLGRDVSLRELRATDFGPGLFGEEAAP